jgi:hypothetical protein
VGRVAAQDDPDAAGESAPLGLDQVADDFLHAPLLGGRVPADDAIGQRADLGA